MTENFAPAERVHLVYKGLIKCTVSPPEQLYLALLPFRARNRLMFGLCKTCMLEGRNRSCTHTGNARHIEGVYTHVELAKAVQDLGYRVVKVHEVWDFENWSTGLFKDYIGRYFTIKEEVSNNTVKN